MLKKIKSSLIATEASVHKNRGTALRKVRLSLPRPKSDQGESLAIKGYRQLDSYSCGAIAGWMVLQALHPQADFEDFYTYCSPDPKNGTSTSRLAKALRAFNVGGSVKQEVLAFSEIQDTINQGFPIITVQDRPDKDYVHWVVIYGFETIGRKKLVYLAGNNFLGMGGDKNPISYREYRKLAEEFESLICWGKPAKKIKRRQKHNL